MLALAGHRLAFRCRIYDPSPSPPAAAVAEHVRGDYEDPAALREFVAACETVTFEIEHLPDAAIATLQEHDDTRSQAAALRALRIARDRLVEKRFLNDLGFETAPFHAVDDARDLEAAIARLGLPLLLKTRTQGYDGHGQVLVQSTAEASVALRKLGGRVLIAEAKVGFERELSIVAVRSHSGDVASYPLAENHHRGGVLEWSLAPAPELEPSIHEQARLITRRLMDALEYVGVITVELFQVGRRLLVNEIAPRVHNSGHWTIEGADTSQFENHLRAILGLPLGSTSANGNWVLFNLLGELPDLRRALALPAAYLHLYDKLPRPGRKIGHVTCRVEDPRIDRARLQQMLGLA